jgi:hypothetical protein
VYKVDNIRKFKGRLPQMIVYIYAPSAFRIVKQKKIDYENQEEDNLRANVSFVIGKLKHKEGYSKKVDAQAGVHHAGQNGQGQLHIVLHKTEDEIIKGKKEPFAVDVIVEEREVHEDRKKRDNHPRQHDEEDPAVTIPVAPQDQKKRKHKKKQ